MMTYAILPPLRPVLLACLTLLGGLLLAGCNDLPPPPPLPRPVEEVMQDFTRFPDPVAMLGSRPADSVKDAAEYYLQLFQPEGPLPHIFETTRIYDSQGALLVEIFDEGRRTWVSLDRISPHLIDATIATEDSTFFLNTGIDTRRMVGAAIQNVEAGEIVSGASTITMQLARTIFLLPGARHEQSTERKSIEIELARQISLRFSKEEILEMYLNLANFGHLTYGPEAAAQVYFGKSAAELNRAEATLLAGIPQQPANLDLFTDFAAARARQRIVLNLMVRHNYLNAEEADAIFRQPVALNPASDVQPSRLPHFTHYIELELDRTLATFEPLPGRAGPGWRSRRAGLEVITSLDPPLQRLAEETAAAGVAALQPRYGMSNAALVALDPASGTIRAMVGSIDFDNEAIDGQVNVAISRRQPGSAIKPILYAAALDDLVISPVSVLWDIPVVYRWGAGQSYRPVNFDGRFHGPVTVRSALANSYNVPAVRLLQQIGGERMLAQARELGIRSLNRPAAEYGPSLSLGAGEVTLLELTGAFRTFANGGRFSPATGLLRVTDSQGRQLPTPQPVQAISPATAFQLTDILSDNEARTPVFGANSVLRLPVPAAVKTGTTTDFRDNLTVGYTRHLVVGVWTGNSDGTPLRGSSGVAGAAPLWRSFLLAALGDADARSRYGFPVDDAAWEFAPPPDVTRLDVCPPRVTCPTGGDYFSSAWLERMPPDNPIADSIVREVVVPSHRDAAGNSYWLSYCRPEEPGAGVLREVVPLTSIAAVEASAEPDRSDLLGIALAQSESRNDSPVVSLGQPIVYYPDSALETFRMMGWALRNRLPVYLGPCADLNYYTVAAGDSWTGLARQVGLSVQELQAGNLQVLRQSRYLLVGDRLLLPRGVTFDAETEAIGHTVVEGESWNSIARRYGLPLRLLLVANPELVRSFYILQPGDRMVVPIRLSPDVDTR